MDGLTGGMDVWMDEWTVPQYAVTGYVNEFTRLFLQRKFCE